MSRQLDDWLEGYMIYTDNTEPADSFRLWTGIFCIAACLKRKCCMYMGRLQFFPNIYLALIAPSGQRKGTAMGPGYELLRALNIKLSAEATTREALIRTLRMAGQDPTIKEEKGVEFHSSLSIFSQELSVFLSANNTQLMSDLTDWFDCRTKWEYSTKDKKLADYINNVWVNLYGATTPSMLQNVLPTDSIGLGLTSRFIFVYELEKGNIIPVPFLNQEQIDIYPKLLHDLDQIHLLKGEFTTTQRFIEEYIEWYTKQAQCPRFTDERLSGYVQRRPTHLLKLCMIMSASRTAEMLITNLDLQRALEVLEKAEEKMPLVFSGMGKNPLAPHINRAMQLLERKSRMSKQELYTHLMGDVGIGKFTELVDTLVACGFANVVTEGKQSYVVRVEGRRAFV